MTRVARLAASATPDARRLILARALRGLGDGFVSVVLPAYLIGLGLEPLEVGVLVTATLLGSAVLTLAVGLFGHRVAARRVLLAACGLMLATAVGLVSFTDFWPLLLVAFVGTINPSGGDVSVFLPTEQHLLAECASARERTALFARYNLGGALAGAVGALCAGAPALAESALGVGAATAQRAGFAAYGALALGCIVLYRRLHGGRTVAARSGPPLERSRGIVLRLAALFSLDSFGGGFVVQSILALWLFQRFALPLEVVGAVFFAAGVLSAFSQLASAGLARRIGLVRTMVFTHLPANVFLVLAAFMPSSELAITFLLLRMALSQMDVPARQSYVMAVVPPAERTAAAGVTNVPRSLATAASPFLAGAMLSATSFGWPLVCGGALKIVYDLWLYAAFRAHEPVEADAGPGGSLERR